MRLERDQKPEDVVGTTRTRAPRRSSLTAPRRSARTRGDPPAASPDDTPRRGDAHTRAERGRAGRREDTARGGDRESAYRRQDNMGLSDCQFSSTIQVHLHRADAGRGRAPSAERLRAPPWRAALDRCWGSSHPGICGDTLAAPTSERPLQEARPRPTTSEVCRCGCPSQHRHS